MTCYSAKRQSTAFVDKQLRARDYAQITAHLQDCPSCAAYYEQVRSVRSDLQTLRTVVAPPRLGTALRVIASRERQAMEETRGSHWKRSWERWRFRIRLLLEPITIPATGGVVSSLILFASLALALDATTSQRVHYDYEMPLYNPGHITANLVPFELSTKEVVLTMSLDSDGHIQDYAVHDGTTSFTGNSARLQYNNISMPDLEGVLALRHPSGDVSIQFLPIAFRR